MLNETALHLLPQLKGVPLTCLAALAIAGNPVTIAWLGSATGYGYHALNRALTTLLDLGLVFCDARRSSWRLAEPSRSLFLLPGPYCENRDPSRVLCDQSRGFYDQNRVLHDQSRNSCDHRVFCDQGIEEVEKDLNCFKKEKELLTSTTGTPDLPSPKDGRGAGGEGFPSPILEREAGGEGLSVDQILAATSLLFGERVLGPAGLYPDTQLLLAWIAEAWTMRHKLRNPARVVYSNLKNNRPPDPRFLNTSQAGLPLEFLTAAGLTHLCPPERCSERCSVARAPDPDLYGREVPALDLAIDDPPDPEPDPSLSLPANVGVVFCTTGTITAMQAWQQFLDAMELVTPLNTFRSLVLPAQLVRFDPEAWVFTIEVPTPRLKALWDDRLVLIACRQLVGVCARPAGILVTYP
jgi:hypothetical protein